MARKKSSCPDGGLFDGDINSKHCWQCVHLMGVLFPVYLDDDVEGRCSISGCIRLTGDDACENYEEGYDKDTQVRTR